MSAKSKKTPSKSKKSASFGVQCCECDQSIQAREQALFVEEEVGRYFCQESCIVSHFTREIEEMEREYGRLVSPKDLTSEDRERFAHLRWTTLEEPEEIWRTQSKSGDQLYTLISSFKPEEKTIWGVAVCLMLRGEPSFLFIAFVTSDRQMVEHYRKGERLNLIRKKAASETKMQEEGQSQSDESSKSETRDRLAEPWTESDSVRASIIGSRREDDISPDDFAFYQKCLEETLQQPTELWSYTAKASKKVYHFIREYEHDTNYWYVVIARDTVDETQIEIMDAFPTKDRHLVNLCRHGKKEVLGNQAGHAEEESVPLKRTVH